MSSGKPKSSVWELLKWYRGAYPIHNPIDWLFFNWETNGEKRYCYLGNTHWFRVLTHPYWSFLTSPFWLQSFKLKGTGCHWPPGLPYIVTSCFPDGGTTDCTDCTNTTSRVRKCMVVAILGFLRISYTFVVFGSLTSPRRECGFFISQASSMGWSQQNCQPPRVEKVKDLLSLFTIYPLVMST